MRPAGRQGARGRPDASFLMIPIFKLVLTRSWDYTTLATGNRQPAPEGGSGLTSGYCPTRWRPCRGQATRTLITHDHRSTAAASLGSHLPVNVFYGVR